MMLLTRPAVLGETSKMIASIDLIDLMLTEMPSNSLMRLR